MLKFLLIVLLAGPESAVPVQLKMFATLAECETLKTEVVKHIPRRADINFVAICAPIKNGTEVGA